MIVGMMSKWLQQSLHARRESTALVLNIDEREYTFLPYRDLHHGSGLRVL